MQQPITTNTEDGNTAPAPATSETTNVDDQNKVPVTQDVPNGLLKKEAMAKVLACSVRRLDDYLADGCPHQKPSSRKVTFDREEVLKWYKERFGQQRRKY